MKTQTMPMCPDISKSISVFYTALHKCLPFEFKCVMYYYDKDIDTHLGD